MTEHLVSIITPVYNSSEFLTETVESILAQTHKNWELLMVDDQSSDNSFKMMQALSEREPRIKAFRNEKNSGPGFTRNYAIEQASGKYIAFLDSDDLWKPHKLETQLAFMQQNDAPFTYSYYDQIDVKGNFLKAVNKLPDRVDYISSIKSNKIGCLTAVFDVDHFGKHYMEHIPRRQDYTLWLKLLKKNEYAYCVKESLAEYRVRPGSISSNKLKLVMDHWNIYKNIEGHNFFQSMYFLCYYIIKRIQA